MTDKEVVDLLKRCSEALYYAYDEKGLSSLFFDLSVECEEMIKKLTEKPD